MAAVAPAPAFPLSRKPRDSQRGLGGDMSMMFFVRCQTPRRFASPEDYLIRGLNVETIVAVHLPTPDWINGIEYSILQPDLANESFNTAIFSLNLSIYGRSIDPADWNDMWFFMHGRVHPYTLTWEVEIGDGLDSSNAQEYTIPALVVRDHSYQPISTRPCDFNVDFPAMPPIVSFTGPILGPGSVLLRDDPISGLRDIQRKCCGFVQLSTFISPGNPTKPPFKGFHPFQVFVIFPIHVNPWTVLCKKMVDKADTSFQPNTVFSCTGKVAGLLRHDVMVQSPPSARDMVFIVVPDTWTFHDRTARSLPTTSLSTTSPSSSPSTNPLDRSKFMTPTKRVTTPAGSKATRSSDSDTSSTLSSPPTSTDSRPDHYADDPTPSKKHRVMQSIPSVVDTIPIPPPSTAHKLSPCLSGLLNQSTTPQTAIPAKPPSGPCLVEYSVPPQVSTPLSDDLNRPYRNRNPPKKFSTFD